MGSISLWIFFAASIYFPTQTAQRHAVLSLYMYSGAPPSCNSCYVCTVMTIWAAFLCGYSLLHPYIFPHKPHNATLFYRCTCIQGRRHLVTAVTSVQS